MSLDHDTLTRVLSLPDSERAELATRLIDSLDPAAFDPGLDDAWNAEIECRLDAADRDPAGDLDWRDAVDRVRRSLRRNPGNNS